MQGSGRLLAGLWCGRNRRDHVCTGAVLEVLLHAGRENLQVLHTGYDDGLDLMFPSCVDQRLERRRYGVGLLNEDAGQRVALDVRELSEPLLYPVRGTRPGSCGG
jgi:hypothetical protein